MAPRMKWEDRWEVVEELGKGGQGVVSRVMDTQVVGKSDELAKELATQIQKISADTVQKDRDRLSRALNAFRRVFTQIDAARNPKHSGALKVLHNVDDARDDERAPERMRREIVAMRRVSHPNLLKIIDFDDSELWYVSEFHADGALETEPNRERFKGDFRGALTAIRPLVAGLGSFHSMGYIHRDVKLGNVFIAGDGRLVLGDFGLVFRSDDDQTRLSGTVENVGSRYWMPHWAEGIRIDDLKPNFDVFGLAKLLWAMVSGKPRLPHWYFEEESRPDYNLCKLFPDDPTMELANRILRKCIVADPRHCLPDANVLLEEIDRVLKFINREASEIGDNVERPCRVCGEGTYRIAVDTNKGNEMDNFGLRPAGHTTFKIFACDRCGHTDLFLFDRGKYPPAWQASE